jgi:pullulanase
VQLGLRGSIDDFTDGPLETINYAECHDNHTLWDRLLISTIDQAWVSEADRRAMDKLTAAALFTAQGIPFIQSGQEFLRTKGGDHNSYNKPDAVNMIRWQQKAANYDVFEYYRGLIALRRAHPLFRLRTAEEVRRAVKLFNHDLGLEVPDGCIAFQIEDVTGKDSWQRAIVLFNASPRVAEFSLPEGKWKMFGDNKRVGTAAFTSSLAKLGETARVAPRSALILGEEARTTAEGSGSGSESRL